MKVTSSQSPLTHALGDALIACVCGGAAVDTRTDVLRIAYEQLVEACRFNDSELFRRALRLEDLAFSLPVEVANG